MLAIHLRLAFIFTLFIAAPALGQDETLLPTGTQSSDSNTSCNATVHTTIDDDPDAPGGDWCTADSNNVNWTMVVTFDTPSASLDTGTDAQAIDFYVRSFDEGQGGDPTIRVDIYDGVACADLHETGATTTLTDAGFPAKITDNWTAAGLSAAADVCVDIVCTKSGGSPGNRNSCDIDALEWDVAHSAGGARRVFTIGDASP